MNAYSFECYIIHKLWCWHSKDYLFTNSNAVEIEKMCFLTNEITFYRSFKWLESNSFLCNFLPRNNILSFYWRLRIYQNVCLDLFSFNAYTKKFFVQSYFSLFYGYEQQQQQQKKTHDLKILYHIFISLQSEYYIY